MDTKPIECFGTDPRAHGVRVEVSPQESFGLPYEQFMYSEFKAGEAHDTLKLFFMNHEVQITGYGLRRVENAMLARDLAWVAARPARHRSLAAEKGFITRIIVRYLDDEESDAIPSHLHD